jgi:hypothetical protein
MSELRDDGEEALRMGRLKTCRQAEGEAISNLGYSGPVGNRGRYYGDGDYA